MPKIFIFYWFFIDFAKSDFKSKSECGFEKSEKHISYINFNNLQECAVAVGEILLA